MQVFLNNNSYIEEIIPLDVREILDELPMPIKAEVARQAFERVIEDIKFF